MPEPVLETSVRLLFRWNASEAPSVRAVRLMVAEGVEDADGADIPWKALGDFTGDHVTLDGFMPGTRYRFAAAPVFADGSIPPEALWETVKVVPDGALGLALPPAPTNFGISQEGGMLVAEWDAVDAGYPVEYEVRMDPWFGGVLVGVTRDTRLRFPWWKSGAQTYWVKARDPRGNYSATQATCAITVKALEDYVTAADTNEHGGGYTGTKTNTVVEGGNLVLSPFGEIDAGSMEIDSLVYPAGFRYSLGTYLTAAIDAGALQTERIELDIGGLSLLHSGLTIFDWTDPIGGTAVDADGVARPAGYSSAGRRRCINGEVIGPADFLVEIDTTPDSGGSPVWDGFRRFVPGLYTFRQYRFRVTLRGDGVTYCRLGSMTIRHRKRNKKTEGTISVTGSPGPTAITFPSGLFISAPVVVAAVLDAAGTEFVVQAADITTSGANLRAYDAAGAEVFTGTIHWHAMGT